MSATAASLRTDDVSGAPANDEREALARRLAAKHAGDDALEILRAAIKEEFPDRIALVSSFGAESAVLLHLVSRIDKSLPVIFLETGKHFAQTLSYRKKLANRLGLTDVRDIRPSKEALTFRDPAGDLWKHDADACCTLRKVEPLSGALDDFGAWITGRKQFHGGGRLHLPAFEASPTHIKVNPLARWSKEDIDAYVEEHDLPAHPLTAQGYPSIGCWPCTHPAAAGEDIRAGRWRGAAKTECGIHGR
ncbi:phosphoadenylyl-sulfate reductase [Hyphococcus luteus]|uniref:Adenosine 5'-phosphosulfate reductase n=1 Tax=Hyphococcus luteus TaxID=2058213 RepID=A0A2S7K5T6_9PROT|nr:phosphoadenylyl-sulfate reductase [Marinicaulis flavus]PQA87849.1 phosphoadenylyl-sulfate reductase [Marinicaulis flavus]